MADLPPSWPREPEVSEEEPLVAWFEAELCSAPYALKYKERNTVERCLHESRAWRGLATRYGKTPASYLAGLQLRGSILWMRSLNPGRGSGTRWANRTSLPLTFRPVR